MRVRFALAVILGLVGVLALNLSIAFADGWFFNAKLDVEGVQMRTIWTVSDDPDGADLYRAHIWLVVPYGANVDLISQMTDAEEVHIRQSEYLSCRADGMEVLAGVGVIPIPGADGSNVHFDLVADGDIIGSASRSVREIALTGGFIETEESPACYTILRR